jgi:hypothetical protein
MKTSGMTRALYDCPVVPLTTAGPEVRLVVATHGAMSSSPSVGVERDGVVYELFVSTLPTPAFTASDVLDLYLHRGSFETVLADEDDEQESDRWYSHTPCGQEFAQILAQWVWNLRLELGQTFSPSELCTTEFASAYVAEPVHADEPAELAENMAQSSSIPAAVYGPPQWARSSFTHGTPSLGVYLTTRWDAALSCQPPPLSAICGGLNEMVLCGSCMPHVLATVAPDLMPCTVSREQHRHQTATSERGALAAWSLSFPCFNPT